MAQAIEHAEEERPAVPRGFGAHEVKVTEQDLTGTHPEPLPGAVEEE